MKANSRRHTDRAASRCELEELALGPAPEQANDLFNEKFRLRPRNQYIPVYLERNGPKFFPAGDVGNGLSFFLLSIQDLNPFISTAVSFRSGSLYSCGRSKPKK